MIEKLKNNKLIKSFKQLFTRYPLLKSSVSLVLSMVMVIVATFAWYIALTPSVDQGYHIIPEITDGKNIQFSIDGASVSEDTTNIHLVNAIPGSTYRVTIVVHPTEVNVTYKVILGKSVGEFLIEYPNTFETNEDVLKFFSISNIEIYNSDPEIIDGDLTYRSIYQIINPTIDDIANGAEKNTIGQFNVDDAEENETAYVVFFIKVNDTDPRVDENGIPMNNINDFQGCRLTIQNLTFMAITSSNP